ncbi:Transporter [Chitinispirillum alkaliphilum]|nr:Transporter [Chitinispirillum alkaliphilum]
MIAAFGLLVKTLIGKAIMRKLDGFFTSIPILKSIYKATRQIVDMVGSSEKESFFTRPVLVEYPSNDIWVIAFNTGTIIDPLDQGRLCYTLFVPTSPNPTSGFVIIVPSHKVKPLDLPVEEAVKTVLTGGMVKVDALKR